MTEQRARVFVQQPDGTWRHVGQAGEVDLVEVRVNERLDPIAWRDRDGRSAMVVPEVRLTTVHGIDVAALSRAIAGFTKPMSALAEAVAPAAETFRQLALERDDLVRALAARAAAPRCDLCGTRTPEPTELCDTCQWTRWASIAGAVLLAMVTLAYLALGAWP